MSGLGGGQSKAEVDRETKVTRDRSGVDCKLSGHTLVGHKLNVRQIELSMRSAKWKRERMRKSAH